MPSVDLCVYVIKSQAYGAAGLIAYFNLRLLRRWMQRPGRPKAGAE